MRNNLLYQKLTARFGNVLIAKEGAEDEQYRICCPFCGDSRYRLYIDCRWGVLDPISGRKNTHLVKCFNEDCVHATQDDPMSYQDHLDNRNELLETVYRGLSGLAELAPPTVVVTNTGPLDWPGKVIRLDRLYRKRPNHPAVVYMKKRGFDPVRLGEEYGFVFCDTVEEQRYSMALGTILMPIYKNGEMYSWISRYIGDEIGGVPISKTKLKKYYNCPGRPLSSVGYNLDRVLCYSTIVIVEGILDCVKTGPFATCLFTKSISRELKKRIVRGLAEYGEDAAVIVMLDPEQDAKEKEKGVPHHIEKVAAALEEYIPNVLRVYLPNGRDPGGMRHEEIMREITKTARKTGISIDLTQRREPHVQGSSARMAGSDAARTRSHSNAPQRTGGTTGETVPDGKERPDTRRHRRRIT
jgi:hypothetical protein